ncbi:50S ribosomal protein L13 [Chloroflexota bacterium]
MKTYSARPADIERQWHVVDASDQILGRMSTQIARWLMGKHRPMFTPSQDTGDFVVVINAAKVKVTGNKAGQKLYYRHSGYPGGFKSVTLEKMMQKNSARVIEHAVKGMLPHTRQGAGMLKRLRVYCGEEHPHQAQTTAGSVKEEK